MKTIALIIMFMLFIIGCSEPINYLPEQLFEYKIEKRLQGDEALKFVNNLHFDNVTNQENEIGFYNDGKKDLIIYITHYKNQDEAKANELKMTEKISPQNSVFFAGKYIEIENEKVYQCYGMGQAHYVFSANGKLFWISVDAVSGQEFIKNYLALIH